MEINTDADFIASNISEKTLLTVNLHNFEDMVLRTEVFYVFFLN